MVLIYYTFLPRVGSHDNPGDGNLSVDGTNGTWSLTIPGGNALTDGTYEVAVTAEDALGNATVDTSSNELVIDTTEYLQVILKVVPAEGNTNRALNV